MERDQAGGLLQRSPMRAWPGPAPWPGPHRGPAGQPGGPPASAARAGSSACQQGCVSCPHQPPSPQAAAGPLRPSSGTVVRRPSPCGEHLTDHRTSPAHSLHRGLRVIAELLGDQLGTSPAAVGTPGRRDGLADLARTGSFRSLQHRREQGLGPDRAGAGMVHRQLHSQPPDWIAPLRITLRNVATGGVRLTDDFHRASTPCGVGLARLRAGG
jgi:hypothetical protein